MGKTEEAVRAVTTKRTRRSTKPGRPLDEAFRALVAGLKASARPSMIIGGIAVIARGVMRLTRDIDATVVGGGTDAIAASDVLSIHGARVPVARAEDLVIYKIAAWRPQDQQDAERLIALHGEHMDLDRVRAFARDLATTLEDPQRVEEVEKVLARTMSSVGRAVTSAPVHRGGRPLRRK